MARLLVFQHVAAQPAGLLDPLIRQRGHRMRFVNFERDPGARPDIDRYHALVVLGGAMNVPEKDRRAHLLTEMRAIERALRADKPVLGICLGAQLLAHVLGAEVRRLPRPEIGWHPLRVAAEGRCDPMLGQLGHAPEVFQWHGYGFGLPHGATHLAGSADCPHQAFRWGRHAYALQFHLEADASLIGRWLDTPGYRSQMSAHGDGLEARIRSTTPACLARLRPSAESAFARFLDALPGGRGRLAAPPPMLAWPGQAAAA